MNCSKRETSQHSRKRTLYQKLSNVPQANDDRRMSSAHVSSHRSTQSQGLGFPMKHHLTLQDKPQRKVGFKSTTVARRQSSCCNKLKLIFNNKPRTHLKQQSQVVSTNTFKSLDSSFRSMANDTERKKSRKTINPFADQCRTITQEIMKKLQIFDDSNFLPKQLIDWITDYFQQERSVLSRIFMKPLKKKKAHEKKEPEPQLERDIERVLTRIEQKQKDNFLMCFRFVSVSELSLFSEFLESLYLEKSKIKMKEIQKCLKDKVTEICHQIRQQQNTDFLLASRKKAAQITNFMHDFKHFENTTGPLKKIASINLNRFRLVNDTDIAVQSHIRKLNEQVKKSRKQFGIESVA